MPVLVRLQRAQAKQQNRNADYGANPAPIFEQHGKHDAVPPHHKRNTLRRATALKKMGICAKHDSVNGPQFADPSCLASMLIF